MVLAPGMLPVAVFGDTGAARADCINTSGSDWVCSGANTGWVITGNNASVTTEPGFSSTIAGSDALRIEGGGGLVYTDTDGSVLNNTAGTGAGLYVNNTGDIAGAPGSVTVTSNGTFTGYHGIQVNNLGSGSTTITVTGAVTGHSDAGIRAISAGTDLTIEAGRVDGAQAGIYAVNTGSGATSVTATDAVTTDGLIGIYAQGQGTDLTVDAIDVMGSRHGILADGNGGGLYSINTAGLVTGASDFGVEVRAPLASGVNITTAAASILEGGNGGLRAVTFADVVVDNAGTIRNLSAASDSLAIQVVDSSAAYINNSGTVLGTVALAGGADIFTNTSGGTWNTAGGANEFGAGADRLNNQAGATIIAAVAGATGTTSFNDLETFENAGTLTMRNGLAGDRTMISGDYVGVGGLLILDTSLGGDASATDQLVVAGDTSGSGVVRVFNAGGVGAPTTNGIKVIDIEGASNGTFVLDGDYVVAGQQAVVAGAYAYMLYRNGVTTPADGDWYLRSQLRPVGPPTPPGPVFQPGAPVFESYPQILLGLNGLPTLQQRSGNRFWSGGGAGVVSQGADAVSEPAELAEGSKTEGQGMWGRIEGVRASIDPDLSTTSAEYDYSIFKMQTGVDFGLAETESGSLVGGLTAHYGHASADVSSALSDGSISTNGYGFGGNLTWYGANGIYVDTQGQVTWYDSDLRSEDLGSLAEGNDGFGYALSIEGGKRIDIGNGLTITPQAQLTYSDVDFDDFTQQVGGRDIATVSLLDGDSLRGRVGVSLDSETSWQADNGTLSRRHLYGIANLYHEFLDGTAVSLSGVALDNRSDRFWGGLGAGATFNWNDDKYSLYGEGSVNTSLADFGDSYDLKGTVGFRLKW